MAQDSPEASDEQREVNAGEVTKVSVLEVFAKVLDELEFVRAHEHVVSWGGGYVLRPKPGHSFTVELVSHDYDRDFTDPDGDKVISRRRVAEGEEFVAASARIAMYSIRGDKIPNIVFKAPFEDGNTDTFWELRLSEGLSDIDIVPIEPAPTE